MNFLKSFVFFIFFSVSLWADSYHSRAQSLSLQADRLTAQSLLQEFSEEISDFDQTTESKKHLEEFRLDWAIYAQTGKRPPQKWFSGYSWSEALNKYFEAKDIASKPAGQTDTIATAGVDKAAKHSISDPLLYSSQRIGSQTIDAIKKHSLGVWLYSGDSERVEAEFNLKPSQLIKLPSPYEAWGIKKYFVPSSATNDGRGRFLMVLPCSKEYLIHYAEMFKYIGLAAEKTLLSQTDFQNEREKLQSDFAAYGEHLKAIKFSADSLVLGYYEDMLRAQPENFIISSVKKVGPSITASAVFDRRNNTRYIALKSDLTIWGESSAHVIRAAIETIPVHNVLFMGSAGGITPTTHIYDVSVPKEFYLDGRVLKTKNIIYEHMSTLSSPRNKRLILGGRHGHTNSPIEQTTLYVTNKIDEHITTIDVEQNLIAQTIEDYNSSHSRKISFGALNVITDKPRSTLFNWPHVADLTLVNASLKSEARRLAVSTAISTVNEIKISAGPGATRAAKPRTAAAGALQCHVLMGM